MKHSLLVLCFLPLIGFSQTPQLGKMSLGVMVSPDVYLNRSQYDREHPRLNFTAGAVVHFNVAQTGADDWGELFAETSHELLRLSVPVLHRMSLSRGSNETSKH